jgi:hypothetical protein
MLLRSIACLHAFALAPLLLSSCSSSDGLRKPDEYHTSGSPTPATTRQVGP